MNRNAFIYLYYSFFVLSGAVLSYLTYESILLFRSHLDTETIMIEFVNLGTYLTVLVPLFSLILLILSNMIIRRKGPGKYFFLTLIYFTGFVIIQYLFVNEQFIYFKRAVGAWEGSLSVNWIIATIIIFIGANFIVINYYIARRLDSGSRRG